MTRAIEYVRPYLYPAQRAAIFADARLAIIEATSKAGKAQPLTAAVWTPSGPRAMATLKIGDVVCASDGGESRVVGIFPQGVEPVYRVTFSDGSATRCSASHLWRLHLRPGGKPIVASLADITSWSPWRRRDASVPQSAPLGLEAHPVPLDPWALGAWIGNGVRRPTSDRQLIWSSPDRETVERMRRALAPLGYVVVPMRHSWYEYTFRYSVTSTGRGGPLPGILQELGLLTLGSSERFIPDVYRYNTLNVRRDVIRGLLDTDGWIDAHGQPHLEQTSGHLSRDVQEVVESLGGSVLTQAGRRGVYRDATGVRHECAWVYRQLLRVPDARDLVTVGRKRSAARPRIKPLRRRIASIKPDGHEETQCIQVDHPDGLYVTDQCIVTHNTWGCICWLFERAILDPTPGHHYWWVAPAYSQSKIAYRRSRQAIPKAVQVGGSESELTIELVNGQTLWYKTGVNPDLLYGEDVHGAVIDEASRFREEAWHAIRSTLVATQGALRVIGNVKGRRNWFYRLARLAEQGSLADAHYAKLTVTDAMAAILPNGKPVISREEFEAAKQVLPEHVIRELFFAEASADEGNPFGVQHIAACASLPGLAPGPAVAWGVDLARHVDWTEVVGLNRQGQVCVHDRWRGEPWERTHERILALLPEGAEGYVDSTGAGDAPTERLVRARRRMAGYVFTSPSKQWLLERLAVGIQGHRVAIPRAGVMREQLEQYEYELTRAAVRYSAPLGLHDDAVIALALAWAAWCRVIGDRGALYTGLTAAEAQATAEAVRPDPLASPTPQDVSALPLTGGMYWPGDFRG